MQQQLETTRIIDRYLAGELSEADRIAFEQKLSTSEKLQKELQLQQLVQEAAIRASFRTDVQKAARRYRLNRIIKWGAAGLGIIAVAFVSTLWITSSKKQMNTETEAPVIATSLMEQLGEESNFASLPIQYFSVPKEGDVFLSDQSVLVSIPQHAFLLKDKRYSGEAIVQFQEALQAHEIVKAGLNTRTGDELLETQGMFFINAFTSEGEKLEINPKVGVYVQVPVDEHKEGMQLWDYVELKNGKGDWQNPRGLSKIPVPVDMSELDFYPEGYENELDKLKWNQRKKQRDSLYLSFENYCNSTQSQNTSREPITETDENAESEAAPVSTLSINSSVVVRFPEVEATFPGGISAMGEFINKTYRYPEEAREKGISGRVYVSFEVDEYGLISNERVEKSVHQLLDKEALRIINAMPRWTPAQNRKRAVRTRVRLPINFTLTDVPSNSEGAVGFNLMIGPAPKKRKPIPPFTPAESLPQVEAQEEGRTEMAADSFSDTPCNYPRISPSKVLAFWNPKFNNTNLATREFERRMMAIHKTCNDAVLKQYTSQLSKPISEIDRVVVSMGYSDFGSFAKEQVGVVNPNNPHMKNLQAFYEKGVSSLKKRAESDQNWEQELRNQWDKHLTKLRLKHRIANQQNKAKNTQEEIAYNQRRTVQKLGLNNQRNMKAVATYPQFGRTIGFTARRTGGYNCDRLVRRTISYETAVRSIQQVEFAQNRKVERIKVEASVKNGTETRETFSITSNGRQRTIVYNSFSFGVEESQKFDRIVAYLFPHQLESYQLMDGENGNYATSLNDDMVYDLCIVGFSDEGYFYFQKQTFNGGNLGLLTLNKISEKKLDASILQLNAKRNAKGNSITSELDWIKAEKKQFREVKRRKDMDVFRERMATIIYPCYSGTPTGTDTTKVKNEEENDWFSI
ncbi:MAG: energy transducer TonB [Flavobacteriales bacterium]|nr:energy transducer TonB [Flavobacteriales bacterium]